MTDVNWTNSTDVSWTNSTDVSWFGGGVSGTLTLSGGGTLSLTYSGRHIGVLILSGGGDITIPLNINGFVMVSGNGSLVISVEKNPFFANFDILSDIVQGVKSNSILFKVKYQ